MTNFDALKNADFDMVKHMVAIGTLDRQTYYAIVNYKLAVGQLRNAPRY